MIPDPYEKTVKIPVKIVNGRVRLYPYGTPLPEIKDGIIGDLIVPEFAIVDQDMARSFSEEKEVLFFPARTTLVAEMKRVDLAGGFKPGLRYHGNNQQTLGVEFELKEALMIVLRGTKTAILKSCKCYVSSLEKEVNSVNQAYTLISEAYEPSRASHTGNVFRKVFYQDGERWSRLEDKRHKMGGD